MLGGPDPGPGPVEGEGRGPRSFERVRRLGALSWALLGVVVLALVVASGLSALSGILIPLVLAVVLATVLEPMVLALMRLRVPAALAAGAGLLVAVLVAAGILAVVALGFIHQLPEISRRVVEGWGQLAEWLRSFDVEASSVEQLRHAAEDSLQPLGVGLIGMVTSTFHGVLAFGIGTFLALFFLFFVLRDGRLFPAWLSRVTGQDESLVLEVDTLLRRSLRGYFRGTAVTALITAPIFIVPLLLLRIPLVLPIVILYFFLSFVPYIGAWITGAFAVLIAFGSGGALAAAVVATSLLVSNGTIQSAVSSWALGASLALHPVAVLLATFVGGVVAGLMGMVLGPPLLSAAKKSVAAVRRHRRERGEEPFPP